MGYTEQFDVKFQEKILALLVRDKQFIISHDDVIKPSHFTKPEAKLLAKTINDYFFKYKELPTYSAINNELEKKSDKHTHLDFNECFELNKYIFTKSFEDLDYVKEETIEFAKRQALYEALSDSANIFNTGDTEQYEEIKKKVEEALKVGVDKHDLGSFYLKGAGDRLSNRLEEEENTERVKISFSPSLNELCSGGLGPEELWVILASTNRGKSSFLMNFAFSGLLQNKKVVYYSLEMTTAKIEARLDSRMGRVATRTLKENTPVVDKKIKEHITKFGDSELCIKRYPRRGASVNTLIAHMSLLEGYYDFKPDLVVVDYGDIMRPITRRGEKRDEQAEIYGELFYLAQTQHVPVITGCQSNRMGHTKDTVDLTETGESWEKVQIADVVLSLNETIEEYQNNKSRIYVAKNRDDRKWDEVQVTFNRSSMYVNEEEDDLEVNSLLFDK